MNAKFSILSFPQRWENNQLVIRALVMPRNFSPFDADILGNGTPAWVNCNMGLTAKLISNPDLYPSLLETS